MQAQPRRLFLALLSLSFAMATARGAELQPIQLPKPETQGSMPLMEALQQRQTIREFNPDRLPLQTIGNLLWAGFGINRPGTGHRTAPSAMNSQEVDIYVALPEGTFVYDPKIRSLKPVSAQDLRARTGGQDFAKAAPMTLIYVADLSRLEKADQKSRRIYATFDAGCICQNVYLYCASAKLATVVHDLDRSPLNKALNLRPDQEIILVQAVGVPKGNPQQSQKP